MTSDGAILTEAPSPGPLELSLGGRVDPMGIRTAQDKVCVSPASCSAACSTPATVEPSATALGSVSSSSAAAPAGRRRKVEGPPPQPDTWLEEPHQGCSIVSGLLYSSPHHHRLVAFQHPGERKRACPPESRPNKVPNSGSNSGSDSWSPTASVNASFWLQKQLNP